MRLASRSGRAVVVADEGGFDLATQSGDRFSSSTGDLVRRLEEIADWTRTASPPLDPGLSGDALLEQLDRLDPPIASPGQIFAIGVNYLSHGEETGIAIPDQPMVFTKFPSAITGPGAMVGVPTDSCDWEVELVAVIGRGGRNISRADALDAVAAFCVGQDISERRSQMAGSPPQFSLAKSFENFAPIGPWLTTLDQIPTPLDLEISCTSDGEVLQHARTSEMIFDLPDLVSYLSNICELRPGDLIFTGTPNGVGFTRNPPRALIPGMTIRSEIEGLGRIENKIELRAWTAGAP